jgi:hypothetical protein
MICYDYPERPAAISRPVRDGAITLQHRVPPLPGLLLPLGVKKKRLRDKQVGPVRGWKEN